MPKWLQFLKRTSYFIPFTFYLLVFAAVILMGYKWIEKLAALPDSAYKDIFSLLVSIALFFCTAILLFGFITVLSSFIYFIWKQKKDDLQVSVQTAGNENAGISKQQVNIQINPVLIPLMGFLRVRIVYDKKNVSAKTSLVREKSRLFDLSYKGHFNWHLPEIREYHIEKIIFYFEDFFQFFSFAVQVSTFSNFFIGPSTETFKNIQASNRKTEETKTRVEELKRVEGELINYKSFESSDDVRRIVWKIYAKNKELMIRVPEIFDPYASDLYIYSSFYSQFKTGGNEVVEKAFLNYYKNACWSVYRQFVQRGFEVKYITDQAIPVVNFDNKDDQVKHTISVSSWQPDVNLKDFVKPKQAAILIISSLSDLQQVKEFAENFGNEITIIYIPLTACLEKNKVTDWIKWIFVENEFSSAQKTLWNVSPLRFQIIENETAIAQTIKHAAKAVTI